MKPSPSRRKTGGEPVPTVILDPDPVPNENERLARIAALAYSKAEARGFVPGQEMDDWLDAEAEIDEEDEA